MSQGLSQVFLQTDKKCPTYELVTLWASNTPHEHEPLYYLYAFGSLSKTISFERLRFQRYLSLNETSSEYYVWYFLALFTSIRFAPHTKYLVRSHHSYPRATTWGVQLLCTEQLNKAHYIGLNQKPTQISCLGQLLLTHHPCTMQGGCS